MNVRRARWQEALLLFAITALALSVRLLLLSQIPNGIHGDEAANGLDILNLIQRGQYPVFFEANTGREPLFIYLQAISVALLGATPFALRLVAALIGTLTIPAVYWMVREAFRYTEDNGRWLAFWTVAFMTVSYWHLTFSRLGLRAVSFPLLAAIAFALFWRAWHRIERGGRFPWGSLVACGAVVGLSLYTYIAARFLPVLITLVVLISIWQNRAIKGYARSAVKALFIIAAVATVVFLPLGVYFVNHPQSFYAHALDVSGLDQSPNLLWHAASGLVQTVRLIAVTGDQNLEYNPAQRALFDPLVVIWLLAGVLVCLRPPRSLPRLAALTWFLVFLAPAVLNAGTTINASIRAIGINGIVYLLPVLAMYDAGRWLQRRMKGRPAAGRTAMLLLPLPFLLYSGVTNLRDYFGAWGPGSPVRSLFETSVAQAAINLSTQSADDAFWVLPTLSYNLGDQAIRFMYRGDAELALLVATEPDTPVELSKLAAGHSFAYLVDWTRSNLTENHYAYADPKRFFEFLLGKHGRKVTTVDSGDIPYSVYEIPAQPDFRVANDIQPAAQSFGNAVQLTGFAFGRTASDRYQSAGELDAHRLPSGGSAWVVLQWEPEVPIDRDLKVSLRLVDANGHVAGQVDDLLVSDNYPFADVWQAGETTRSYHLLPTLPGILPGVYQLQVVVYDPATGREYEAAVEDGQSAGFPYVLGELEVEEPITPVVVQPQQALPGDCLSDDLCLLGYDLSSNQVNPGDRLALTLFWQVRQKPAVDYSVSLELRDPSGNVVANQPALLGEMYPTTRWPSGAILRTWQDLPLAPTVPAGSYQLRVNLSAAGQPADTFDLGYVQVEGRPHRFESPTVAYPMNLVLGDSINFLGYEFSANPIQSGQPLTLTLYWQPTRQLAESYTVFVHLLDGSGNLVAQKDSLPGEGSLPTTSWVPGEYLIDSRQVALPEGLPAGVYQLVVGLYDAVSGTRLSVANLAGEAIGDQIKLDQELQVTSN